MAQDMLGITNSLFGVQPSFQSDFAQGMQLAGQSATGIGTGLAYAGGRQLGRGLMSAAGVVDPETASADRAKTFAKELQAQGLSMQSAEGMNALAQKLSDAGDFKAAQAAAALANQFASERAGIALKQTQTMQKQQEIANEAQLRQELQALGPNATEEQLMSVLQKYGSPDKVIAALQRSQAARENLEFRRQADLRDEAFRRESLGLRQGAAEEKRQEKLDKQIAAGKAAIAAADRVINEVQEAKKMVSGATAGAGGLLAGIPMTPAKDLSAKLTTIKANLGFDRLQQMRDASPTGGALGQVAVQELVALQSTIASLDQMQSPSQLKSALDKIEGHYNAWRNTIKQAEKQGDMGVTTPGFNPAAGNDPLGLRR